MRDLAQLRVAADSLAQVQQDLSELVAIARSNGATWAAIGVCLRISKQAAQQRFGS